MISNTVLVLTESFDDGLSADAVAEAIARGLSARALRCDLCPIVTDASRASGRTTSGAGFRGNPQSALLDERDFNSRLRTARAIVIAARLDDRTLAGGLAFEAATRARQAGVPAYAVTAENALDPFEARIVDLQVVLEARTPRALSAAGGKLAREIFG